MKMSKLCCVCNEVKESKDNVIFNCKGQGCDVSVHQGNCLPHNKLFKLAVDLLLSFFEALEHFSVDLHFSV